MENKISTQSGTRFRREMDLEPVPPVSEKLVMLHKRGRKRDRSDGSRENERRLFFASSITGSKENRSLLPTSPVEAGSCQDLQRLANDSNRSLQCRRSWLCSANGGGSAIEATDLTRTGGGFSLPPPLPVQRRTGLFSRHHWWRLVLVNICKDWPMTW
ncbi:hypothetical protein LWI29_023766 [Acer saccharum]|uniref:Uncharacterized protein n=1 Tax=Acer saccharum TaxID=4024 RepID=A0AA39STT7_ACESA|nr:hypothetical protein LWI29_023766 [Acer saccharum]